MKPSVSGLLIATLAFVASTVYLAVQLREERARGAALVEAGRGLNARIAALEATRAGLANAQFGDRAPALSPVAASEIPALPTDWPKMPEPPPSVRKRMKKLTVAVFNEMHFDLEDKLSLTVEQADKLIDLLAEQQTAGNDLANVVERDARRERDRAEIADLLGPVKAARFEEYKQSDSVRVELMSLGEHLKNSEVPLSDAQRKRLVTAMYEEFARVPQPEFPERVPDEEQYMKSYATWHDDYETRVNSRAGGILSSEQLAAYNDLKKFLRNIP
jgi:uncharacterized protein YggL (DUF469 family)